MSYIYMLSLYITILAGGAGKRMNSTIPKVLHLINDKPMIVLLLETVIKLSPTTLILVVGKDHLLIKQTIEQYIQYPIIYAIQEEPLGTGDAVKSTLPFLDEGINLILNGDTPLLSFQTIQEIYNHYIQNNNSLQITAINLKQPFGNGRIIQSSSHLKIVEEKDCTDIEKSITLVNCGIYIINNNIIKKCIPLISNNNQASEYYLTDIVEIYQSIGGTVNLIILPNNKKGEIYNINTPLQLRRATILKSIYNVAN